MREISILLEDIEPLSINRAHRTSRKGFIYKPKIAVDFDANIKRKLQEHKELLDEFVSSFNPFNHHVYCNIYYYVPIGKFYTGKGSRKKISSQSKDLDNLLKYTIDGVFKFISLNDVIITRIETEKIPKNGTEWSIVIQLSIQNLFSI